MTTTEPRPSAQTVGAQTVGPDWSAAFSPSARRMSSSVIREILKVTQSPDVISFAGGLPAPELFPVEAVRQAASTVLGHQQRSGLDMWLLIAEMVLALGLIVFIMWWTLRARVDHPVEKTDEESSAPSTPPDKD